MSYSFKIGGEFEIAPKLLGELAQVSAFENPYEKSIEILFSSGRSALMAILADVMTSKPKKVYLPYYICSSVVNACRDSGFETIFYELDKNFLFPLEFLDQVQLNTSILLVNYFGLVDDNPTVVKIKKIRSDVTVISDQVQSLWTCHDSLADYSFTSLRKHVATPDGAVAYQKKEPLIISDLFPINSFYNKKIDGAVSKYLKAPDEKYLKQFEQGEALLDEEKTITKASEFGNFVYSKIDSLNIAERRKSNYKKVYEMGLNAGLEFIFPYSERDIPLVVPIRVKNQTGVRKALMGKNIYLPVHWPLASFNDSSKMAIEMANSELSLVIDQRYSLKEMEYQMNNLIKLL